MQLPVVFLGPVRFFELVLDVEQPNADRCRDNGCRNIDQQEGHQTAEPDDQGNNNGHCRVGAHCGNPELPTRTHVADRQAVFQNEDIAGAKNKQHQRMAIEAVHQPAPPPARAVFFNRQRQDVAHAALVQIAVAGMVDRMGLTPNIIGGQCQHTQRTADPVLQFAVLEERRMAAVVLDAENAYQEHPVHHSKPKCQPRADRQRHPGQGPEQEERAQRQAEFNKAACVRRFAIVRQDAYPILGVTRRFFRRIVFRIHLVFLPSMPPRSATGMLWRLSRLLLWFVNGKKPEIFTLLQRK